MQEKDLEIFYRSADGTMQPALLQKAVSQEPRPLVVALHTWSYWHLNSKSAHYFEPCAKLDWHCIYPAFRGPNVNPDACGSDLVVGDIVAAVEYAKSICNVDEKHVYLIGGSGGGHLALLMAGRHPELWTAVSAWCPISDIAAWHRQCAARKLNYASHIEQACSGDPETDPAAHAEAVKRSPLTYLENAFDKCIIDINTGIHDGHTGSVPISQAVNAFNMLAAPADRIAPQDIDFMVETEKIPEHLQFAGADPAYGEYTVLLRRTSGKVRLTLFEGGHDILPMPGLNWCANQSRGKEAVWNSGNSTTISRDNQLLS